MSTPLIAPLIDIRDVKKLYPVGPKPGLLAKYQKYKVPQLLHAVDGVSLDIGEGESVGLVGESGCGKSTLVRLITRMIDPTAGEIVFAGRDLAGVAAKQMATDRDRANIQMVFQDPTDSLNPRYTAFDTIAEPLKLLMHVHGDALRDRVNEIAAQVGLPPELLSRFPHQLSGGQKARVGIARAIALKPKLLILDEPTAALDVSVQAIILHLLADLKKQLGMSYLFVSHDLNVVRLLCDRIFVMYLGRIVESGTAAEVFAKPGHPYTRALIASIPKGIAGRNTGISRIALPGEPQSPINPSVTCCRLVGRCPIAKTRCETEMPLLREVGSGVGSGVGPKHSAACHFSEKM